MSTPRVLLENAGDKLPSPSGVALAIMELWDKDDTTVEQLSRLIQTDPALCGRLLKLANSAALGARPTASVPDAIVRVGMRTVGQIAVSFSLIDQAREGYCDAFPYPEFWSQSLLMALISRSLAEISQVSAPDDLFACGLLARVGELAFATIYPKQYSDIIRASDGSLMKAERSCFGFDHNDLSHELMIEYGVPEILAGSARYHEGDKRPRCLAGSREAKLVDTFHIAYRLSFLAGADIATRKDEYRRIARVAERLDLADDVLDSRLDNAIEYWREWSKMLELPVAIAGHSGPTAVLETLDDPAVPEKASPAADDGQDHGGEEQHTEATITQIEDLSSAAAVRALEKEQDSDASEAVVDAGAGAMLMRASEEEPDRFRAAALVAAQKFTGLIAAMDRGGFEIRLCEDEESALRIAVTFRPEMFLVDGETKVDAVRFCRLVRSTEWGASIYIFVTVDRANRDNVIELFDAGADSVIPFGIPVAEFASRLRAVERYLGMQVALRRDQARLQRTANELAVSQHKYEQLSLTDQLTLLPNRRFGMRALQQAWQRGQRTGEAVALVMIDLDNFKNINDVYGHAAGDEVLCAAARVMESTVRQDESICRLGGEEFMLVGAAGESLKPLLVASERLRRKIAALQVKAGGATIRPTASFGVVERETGDATADDLLSAADRAMYLAKKRGRNRIAFRINGEFKSVQPR